MVLRLTNGIAPSPTVQQVRTYVVQAGDTLSGIAHRYGITWQALYFVNREVIGSDPDKIIPGQRLVIR
jgi:nucleoid-associated protein YgaU